MCVSQWISFNRKVSVFKNPQQCHYGLNPAASHYRRAVIGTCTVTRNSMTGEPVGTFACACGFVYARNGPDRCQEDRARIGRLVAVGPIWEKRLYRLIVTEKKSFSEAARQLLVDVKTAQRHFACMMEEPGETPPLPIAAYEAELKVRRERWLGLCAAHPDSGVKAIRLMGDTDYFWLYRHDRTWLQSHTPQRKPRPAPASRIDWWLRDAHLAAQIGPAAVALKGKEGRPVRVTVSAVGKHLGVVVTLHKRLGRLPQTAAALSSVIETREEFAIRRLRLAAEELRRHGGPILAWKLVRIAGLRPGYSASVAGELERIVTGRGEDVDHGATDNQEMAVS